MLARLVNEERTPPTALQVEPEPRLSRSMRTTSLTPASARWNAQLVPMTPPPMMTTSALGGTAFSANLASTISVVACREPDGVPTLAVGGQALAFAARHQSVTAPSRHRRSPGAPRAAGGPPRAPNPSTCQRITARSAATATVSLGDEDGRVLGISPVRRSCAIHAADLR